MVPASAVLVVCYFLNGSFSMCVCYVSWYFWYGFASSLTLRKKVSSKYPIPVNMSLNSPCIFIVVLALVALFVPVLDLQQSNVLMD